MGNPKLILNLTQSLKLNHFIMLLIQDMVFRVMDTRPTLMLAISHLITAAIIFLVKDQLNPSLEDMVVEDTEAMADPMGVTVLMGVVDTTEVTEATEAMAVTEATVDMVVITDKQSRESSHLMMLIHVNAHVHF